MRNNPKDAAIARHAIGMPKEPLTYAALRAEQDRVFEACGCLCRLMMQNI
jgi:hypothetical protein